MFFLCGCFICLLLLVSAWAGVIMEITGSGVAYMTKVRSLSEFAHAPLRLGQFHARLARMHGWNLKWRIKRDRHPNRQCEPGHGCRETLLSQARARARKKVQK
jgi:hypothetical protein